MQYNIPTDKEIAEKIAALIVADLSHVHSINELAGQAGVTPFTLRRVFKAHHGASLSYFSRTARIEKAKQLLMETNNTLQMIAEAVGYSESSNFQHAFRSMVGCTARTWRKRGQTEMRGL